MGKKKISFSDEDQASYMSEGDGDECTVCRQDFRGSCPLNNPDCPCLEDESGEEDEDEDKGADFEDVGKVKELLADDAEADRLTEEEGDFSADADAEDS